MIKLYIDILYDIVWFKDKIVYVSDMDFTQDKDIKINYLNNHWDIISEWIMFKDIYPKKELTFMDKVFNALYIKDLENHFNK